MTDSTIRTLREHRNAVSEMISSLNELLLEDEENYNLTIKQRAVIQNARNMYKLEYADLGDYLEQCESIYKHKEADK